MPNVAFLKTKLKSLHYIQLIHIWNATMGIILFGLLVGVATTIRSFISNGSELAGFGNYNTFAYPATYVYMLIPSICSLVYSVILAFDPSPSYPAWRPSKTFISSVALFAGALFFASLFPVLPSADMITRPESALSCSWADFMEWRTIYNNVDIYPWVNNMDIACGTLQAADAFCWVITIGWLALVALYVRRARQWKPIEKQQSSTSWPMEQIKKTETKTEIEE
ncbi:hypothetical protein BJV82DRAFT_602495 [Fennellomyces sp. T-0311]|nr:hypothetical protein BJV82DRAFT_602495 [Fennellomyces sp. T-0311]